METINLNYKGENKEILVVEINRPHAMNAMNTKFFTQLLTVFRESAYSETLRCVILTGAGTKAFSVGGDLKERNGMSNRDFNVQHQLIEDLFITVHDFPLPVIAAVEGYALGGGCELALLADFIIASESSKFGLTEVKIGIMPGGGGLQNLPRAIGVRRAKELIYTGRIIDASLAYEWGLVNKVVNVGEALGEAEKIALKIVDNAPLSVKMAKSSISRGTEVDFHTGYVLDITGYNILASSEDRVEGIAAFNEKRKPEWKNR
ncbi:enoyl-CoA hydratase/isomerase family protein [Oceanobacillus saliphilus]|uniref:enoyl-CoA hydratase/isomerase family protein n=1 Tax=Oceanobacillus saliphilus TaxID=2925834 RepID=UPI00201D6483|nr:enoyl-CoA hydratase-related protein [Oceanobacillus saliphilus]